MFHLTERELRAWERRKYIPESEVYRFPDVKVIQKLAALRDQGWKPMEMERTVTALRTRFRDLRNPLLELNLYRDGKRIGVQAAGFRLDPFTGQLYLDFEGRASASRVHAMPASRLEAAAEQERAKRRADAERWFHQGLEAEQNQAPAEEVIKFYETALELDPNLAPALVNLGTLFFNAGYHKQSEDYYRRAVEADKDYPLAHFNLANLFDERGERSKALYHYLAALKLNPNYADAHYNLALLYQTMNETMKALRHWKTYLKLDPGSSWASIARREMRKLRDATVIAGPKLRKNPASPAS